MLSEAVISVLCRRGDTDVSQVQVEEVPLLCYSDLALWKSTNDLGGDRGIS